MLYIADNFITDNTFIWLYIWVTWRSRHCFPFASTWVHLLFFCDVCVADLFVFSVVLCFLVLFVFVLCLVCPMLPVSLDCPFLIASSVFSNVYFHFIMLLIYSMIVEITVVIEWLFLNQCSNLVQWDGNTIRFKLFIGHQLFIYC